MTFLQLTLIALGVSADAFAVAIGKGLHMRRFNARDALLLAGALAVFQALMPVLGWLLGRQFATAITPYDHWVAFGLLAFIGGKMLWEVWWHHDVAEVDQQASGGIRLHELLLLAIATSIDALAVGLTLAFFDQAILATAGYIGLVTFVMAFAGVVVGQRVGARFSRVAEVAGGLILVAIGVNILVEGLTG